VRCSFRCVASIINVSRSCASAARALSIHANTLSGSSRANDRRGSSQARRRQEHRAAAGHLCSQGPCHPAPGGLRPSPAPRTSEGTGQAPRLLVRQPEKVAHVALHFGGDASHRPASQASGFMGPDRKQPKGLQGPHDRLGSRGVAPCDRHGLEGGHSTGPGEIPGGSSGRRSAGQWTCPTALQPRAHFDLGRPGQTSDDT